MPIRVFVDTTGCAVNRALSEYLLGLLKQRGYELVGSPEDADVIILNYCAIKKATEDFSLSQIEKMTRKENAKIIVAGCLAQGVREKIVRKFPNVSLVGVYNLLEIPNILHDIVHGKTVRLLSFRRFSPLGLPRIRSQKFIAVVPIAQGCLGECTFCIDRLIWGRLRSYPLKDIVEEVKRLVASGVKEIRLSGQDTGPYGWDLGYTLADLLAAISDLEGDFMVRVGMASPDTFARVVDDVLRIFKEDRRFYRYFHLPVQSGSDRILKLMGRRYSRDDFVSLIRSIREKFPDATIATDIIVAFPTETEQDFSESLSLIEEIQPDIVNISRYGDRPGTPAAAIYPKIHSRIAKERSRRLASLVMRISLERNRRYVGRKLDVLLLESQNSRLLGRTRNYRRVVVEGLQDYLGSWRRIRISDATWKTLYGEFVTS